MDRYSHIYGFNSLGHQDMPTWFFVVVYFTVSICCLVVTTYVLCYATGYRFKTKNSRRLVADAKIYMYVSIFSTWHTKLTLTRITIPIDTVITLQKKWLMTLMHNLLTDPTYILHIMYDDANFSSHNIQFHWLNGQRFNGTRRIET